MKREINLLFLLLLLVLGRSITATAQISVSDGNPYEEDFEGSTTSFLFENNTSYYYTNQWYIGTAASHGGQKGLYITEDGGTSNTYKQNENSMVFAYVPIGLGNGKHQISYDWRGKGDRNNAYLRVALVPESESPFREHPGPEGFGNSTLPTGWIALDGGSQLAESSVWRSEMARITISEGGYYLVFAWRTNSSNSFMNPAAGIDNVRVEKVNVFVPEQPVASNITAQSATITWTDTHASTWNIRYKKTTQSEWNTISSVSQNSYTLTSLDSGAEYEVQVQAVDGNQQSPWTVSTVFHTAVMVSQGNPYEENFEGSTLFQFSNRDVLGAKWHIGTAAHNGTGSTKGLYISDDDGATNSYINSCSIGTTDYAYVQFSLENGRYDIAYDWRCQGLGESDFMRVAVVPASTDFVGGSMPTGFSYNTLPTDWIAADGGSQLWNQSQWTTKNVSLTLTNAGDYYLVFVWHNHGGFYDNPPAAVDNIRVEKWIITTPAELAISNITTNSAKATWQDTDASAWNLRYKKTSQSEWNTISALSQKEYTLTGLDSGTEYEMQVQAVEDDQQSAWTASVTFCTKFAVDINHPYMENFEGSTLFQFANGNTGNKWYIGTAAYNGSGTKGLYISNDDGNTNAYVNTASIAYAYVPITLEAGKHEISYDWKCKGESSADYMRVVLVSASVNLTGGPAPSGFSYNSLPTNWMAADGGIGLNLSQDWSSKTAGLTISGEGDYYLVFVWRNDGSQNYNPPAAIDNILVAKVNAFTPSQLAISDITTNSAKATWTDNDASAWNIRYKKTSDSEWNAISSVSQNPYTLTGLDSDTEYEVQVQATSTEGQSAWTASAIFSTVPTYTLTYDANGATSGNVPVDPNSPYIADATVTVLGNTGGLIKTNHNFNGWNTKADGTGTAYAAGETFQISAHTVLYAQWLYDMTIIDPDNLHASLITGKSATLNWSAGSNSNPTGWNLDYKLHDAQEWTRIATNLAAATTSYLLEGLSVDTEYDFRVQAAFGDNTSNWVATSFSTASTIVIGSGIFSLTAIPTYTGANYSFAQQIYTAEELGRIGYITSIAFLNIGNNISRKLDVYLVETEKDAFASTSDWVQVSPDDLCFSGYAYFVSGGDHGVWSTIELQKPFKYDGDNNVCLVVNDKTKYRSDMYSPYPLVACRIFETEDNSTLYVYDVNGSTQYDPSSLPPANSQSLIAKKNQLKLVFVDLPAPKDFNVRNVTTTTATLGWVPGADETEWELQCIEAGGNWNNASSETATGDSYTHTFSNLEPGMTYNARIRAVDDDDYSEWIYYNGFVTECAEEAKIPVSFIMRNYKGTGWNGTIDVYDQEMQQSLGTISLSNGLSIQTVTINACLEHHIELVWDGDSDYYPYSIDAVIDGNVVLSMEENSYYDSYGSLGEFIVEHPSCPVPQNLTADCAPGQASLTWDGNGGSEWIVRYKQIGSEYWKEIDEPITTTSYSLLHLAPACAYKFQVFSLCDGELPSYSVPRYSTIPMCPDADQCLYTFELDVEEGYDWWYAARLVVVDADSYEEIASITIDEGDDIPKTVDLPLCQGTNIEIWWQWGGINNVQGFDVYDGNGELIASRALGEEFDDTEPFYSGTVVCGSCKVPRNLQASNVGTESATLSWTPGNEETAWNLQFRRINALTGLNDWTGIEVITMETTSITIDTLSPLMDYQFRVQAVCGEEEESTWSRACTFSTFMCDPEDQCTYTIEMQDSFGDGWNGASLEVKDVETNATIASITMTGGSESSTELSLCDGRNVAFVWHQGQYDDECSFEVYDGNDNDNPVVWKDQDTELGEGAFLIGTVDCESGFTETSVVQLIVNGEVEATLNATVGEPIDLTPYIPAEAPTDGFEFYGWYRNDECPDCFNYNYEWAPVTYGNTHTASIDDYPITTIKAIFCQPVGKTYMEFNSIPQNDTLLILGNGTSQYGLNGSATPIMLAFDDDGNFLEEWVDGNQQPQSLESLLWIVESVDDGFHLRNKANNTYLAINDGQICSTGQNGAYLFHHEIHGSEFGDFLYIKVGENTHLEFDTDHFIVANDADYYYTNYGYYYSNVIFNSKQKIGKHYTTRFLIYGDGDTFEATPAVHIINGEVTNHERIVNGSDGIYPSGLIIIKDGGVFNDRGELYNYDEDVLIIEDGGQLIHRGEVVATVEKDITGYGAGNANTRNGWNFIATPIGDGTEVSTIQTESAYDLYRYDEPSRFWLDTDENRISTLDNSTGYLYANEEDVTLQFKGLLYTNSNVGKTLSCQAEGDLAGFNLIGNPYAYNLGLNDIYFDSYGDHQSIESIYVIDGTRIVVAQNDAAIVKPCEGFFVKALEDEAYFVFAPNRLGGLAYSSMPTPDLKIEVAKAERGAELLDRAYLNFNGARNVEKLVLDKNATRLSLVSEGKDYAALSTSNEGTMPLSFEAAQNGIYTLTVSAERTEMAYLHLVDKLTGADIDLLESGSYTFTATPSDDAMRFEIVFKTK